MRGSISMSVTCGAEAVEDGGELDAHRARADDRERSSGPRCRFRISMLVRMRLGVGLKPGQHARFRAGGDDDVLRFERARRRPPLRTSTWPRALQRGVALDPLHLVLLQQELDALGVLGDDARSCARSPWGSRARGFSQGMPVLLGVQEVLPHVGRVQQRLGGDAAHQQAGAAQPRLLFDQGRSSGRTGRRGWRPSSRRGRSR